MSSTSWYLLLVAAVGAERLVELVVARRNERWMRQRGGVEVGAGHYPAMVALHAAFLVACPLEVLLLDRPWRPALAGAMLVLLLAAVTLRWWVVWTLGHRWTTRVYRLPGVPLVRTGPYRWLRHPNYLAVVLELAALPLVHGAWLTAVGFGLANAAVLVVRVQVEEGVLQDHRFAANEGHAAEEPAS